MANVSFMHTLPKSIRIASSIYNLLIVICVIPILIIYNLATDWQQAVYMVVERLCAGLLPVWLVVSAASFLINSKPDGRIASFIQTWDDFQGNGGRKVAMNRSYTNWLKASLVLLVLYWAIHICLTSIVLSQIDIDDFQRYTFPSLPNYTMASRFVAASSMYLNQITYHGEMVGMCLYLLTVFSLCGECCNLRMQLTTFLSSAYALDPDLERFRYRYENLLNMISQVNAIFCWMLGASVIKLMTVLCTSLYIIVVGHSYIVLDFQVLLSVLMLWLIMTPAVLLTREVRLCDTNMT